MLKKIFLIIGLVLGLLFGFTLVNTLSLTSKQIEVDPIEVFSIPDSAVAHLQEFIRIPSISYDDTLRRDTAAFWALHRYLENNYPHVHNKLEKRVFNYSLLYKWEGTDASLNPIILMAHLDVVPVDSSNLDGWTAAPFSGALKENMIVGRGAMDVKSSIIGMMEAVEAHLAKGLQPKRTIYLAFGHDEEIGGFQGARVIAQYLKKQGVRAELVLDEGGFMAEGMVPGIDKPVAIVNTGEKGYVSYKLSIKTSGGHSSAPPKDNTIGSLATAITKLEANQRPYKMLPVIEEQLSYLGPEMSFSQKLVFANPWLFKSVLLPVLNVHTTTAPTIFHAGVKDNVIPTEASAVINFRIVPGETYEEIKEHIIETVDDDRVEVSLATHASNPSAISSAESPSFQYIAKTIRQISPEVIVSPGLLTAGTDSKHYAEVSDNIYRFLPIRINEKTLSKIHGANESISVEAFEETIRFYHQLIGNLDEL